MCNSSNDGSHVISQQCMNIDDEIFINNNIEGGLNVDNNDAWISDDSHKNIYCNKNETITRTFQNEEEMKTYILTGLRDWGLIMYPKRK